MATPVQASAQRHRQAVAADTGQTQNVPLSPHSALSQIHPRPLPTSSLPPRNPRVVLSFHSSGLSRVFFKYRRSMGDFGIGFRRSAPFSGNPSRLSWGRAGRCCLVPSCVPGCTRYSLFIWAPPRASGLSPPRAVTGKAVRNGRVQVFV